MVKRKETPSEANKRQFEIDKLELEQKLLTRQLSFQGTSLEWLKAAAVPVTLLGALLAYIIGTGQLRETQENQTAERFDKALTRLASTEPNQRMTGVASLELFLESKDSQLQKQALQFLVNSLSTETDTRVQNALLDTIAGLNNGTTDKAILNSALSTAISRSRNLTKIIVDSSRGRIIRAEKTQLKQFSVPGIEIDDSDTEIPAAALAKLSDQQYLQLLEFKSWSPFDNLTEKDKVPLLSLKMAIQSLIGLGAISANFDGIYCHDCDFRLARAMENIDKISFKDAWLEGANFSGVALKNAIFENAHLFRAKFEHSVLVGSHFENADLGRSNFFAVDLHNAKLTVSRRFQKLTFSPFLNARSSQVPIFPDNLC